MDTLDHPFGFEFQFNSSYIEHPTLFKRTGLLIHWAIIGTKTYLLQEGSNLQESLPKIENKLNQNQTTMEINYAKIGKPSIGIRVILIHENIDEITVKISPVGIKLTLPLQVDGSFKMSTYIDQPFATAFQDIYRIKKLEELNLVIIQLLMKMETKINMDYLKSHPSDFKKLNRIVDVLEETLLLDGYTPDAKALEELHDCGVNSSGLPEFGRTFSKGKTEIRLHTQLVEGSKISQPKAKIAMVIPNHESIFLVDINDLIQDIDGDSKETIYKMQNVQL